MTLVTLAVTASGHQHGSRENIWSTDVMSCLGGGEERTISFMVSKYYIWLLYGNGQIMLLQWLGGVWMTPAWLQCFNCGQWDIFIGVTNSLQCCNIYYLLHDQGLYAAWPQVIRKPWLHSLWMEFIGNGHISYSIKPSPLLQGVSVSQSNMSHFVAAIIHQN